MFLEEEGRRRGKRTTTVQTSKLRDGRDTTEDSGFSSSLGYGWWLRVACGTPGWSFISSTNTGIWIWYVWLFCLLEYLHSILHLYYGRSPLNCLNRVKEMRMRWARADRRYRSCDDILSCLFSIFPFTQYQHGENLTQGKLSLLILAFPQTPSQYYYDLWKKKKGILEKPKHWKSVLNENFKRAAYLYAEADGSYFN